MDFNRPLSDPEPIFGAPTDPPEERGPDGAATVPCSRCGSTERPDANGQCPNPKCRGARVGNKLASVHDGRAKLTRADLDARDALLDRLLRERGGRSALDIVSQLRVEDFSTAAIQLGKVTRRLETLGAVSEAGNKRSSLVDTYNTFSARCERLAAELPAVASHASSSVPDDLASATTDELITRLTVSLRLLLDQRDEEARHAEFPARGSLVGAGDDGEPRAAGPLSEASAMPAGKVAVPTSEPAPEVCEYCRRPCVGVGHVAYAVLHWADPIEVKKRDEEATKIMYAQVGKPLPDWYR